MAVPSDLSLRNFYGTFEMNKTLSDDTDKVLQLQGIGWLVRTAIKKSSVTLAVKEYTDAEGKVHIDIIQTTTGGFTTEEKRVLDGNWGEETDKVFGKVKGHTEFLNVKDIEDPFQRDGWDPKFLEEANGELIRAYAQSIGFKGGEEWQADQIWGFAIVEGVRRFVRHIIVSKGKTIYKVKTVYDFVKK